MRTAVACLFAVCAATVSSVLLALLHGYLNVPIAAISLGIGLAGGIYVFAVSPPETNKRKFSTLDWLLLVVFALFALRAFCWVIFNADNDVKVLSPNNLGDMALHLTYINYLSKGARFWPENPIFAGVRLHYPLGMDLFNALLTLVGINIYRGLIWVGLIASAVTWVTLYRWGRWFAIAGFLFNGGLAGFIFLKELSEELLKFFSSGQLSIHFEDYQADMAWKSIPLAMFVTQRGLLYAIPAGLVLLNSWRARWFSESDSQFERIPVWLEAVFYSTMPLFHLHTFMFLSALLGVWVFISPRRDQVLRLLAVSLLPATIFVSLVTGLFEVGAHAGGGLIHLKPGWMQEEDGFFHFWLMNFGALPFFTLALLTYLGMRFGTESRLRHAMAFVAPALGVFLISCFVMFAPWEWDNTKLMIWSYLVILPFLWDLLLKPLAAPAKLACCVLLFFSGLVSLIGGIDQTHKGYSIAQRAELDSIIHVTSKLPVSETFAAFPTYNHPLLLSGCKVVEGYPGHLSSHGIPYREQEKKLEALMMGQPQWREIARELHVRYLFWGTREREKFVNSGMPWIVACDVVAEGSWGAIYDLAE